MPSHTTFDWSNMTETDTTEDAITELQRIADKIFTTCDHLPHKDVLAVLSKAQGPLIPIIHVDMAEIAELPWMKAARKNVSP